MPFVFRARSVALYGGPKFLIYSQPAFLVTGTSRWFEAAAHSATLAGISGNYEPIILAQFLESGRDFSTRDIPDLAPGLFLNELTANGVGTLTLTLDERSDVVRLGGASLVLTNADTLLTTFDVSAFYGMTVLLLLGFTGLVLSEYLPLYTGAIDRYNITRPHIEMSLVDTYVRQSINLSVPLDTIYFPGASPQVSQQHIPLLLGILLDAPTLQVGGNANGTLAFAMSNTDTTAILSEKSASFPAAGTIDIGVENGIPYTSRSLINRRGKTYLQLNGLGRSSPVAHNVNISVVLTNVTYQYLIGYAISALHAVRDAGVHVSPSSYTLLTVNAPNPVSILEFTAPRTGAITVDADGGIDEANRLTNGGFEAGDLTGWTTGVGATASVGTTSPTAPEGTYRASLTGALGAYKDLSQDFTTALGQPYQLTFTYQDRLSTGSALTNGGFETSDFTGWVNSSAVHLRIIGTTTDSRQTQAQGSFEMAIFPNPSTGPVVNESLRQDATVVSGVSYTLTFWYALQSVRRNTGDGIPLVSLKVGTTTSDELYVPLQQLALTYASTQTTGSFPLASGDFDLHVVTLTFTTSATNLRITFVFTDMQGNTGPGGLFISSAFYLDAVSVTLTTVTTSKSAFALGTPATPTLYASQELATVYDWKSVRQVFTAQDTTTRLTFQSQYAGSSLPSFFDDAFVKPAIANANNPVDLMRYVLTAFPPAAPINEVSFANARDQLLDWQFGADLLNPGDREAILQSMAQQCGSILFRNALGEYTLTVLNDSRNIQASFTPLNIVEGNVSVTTIPIDSLYSSIYVYFGGKTGGGTSPNDFSSVTYATPTASTHPAGPLLSLQCASMLGVTRKEQRLDFFATWIQDLETANLLLSSLVPRHTTLFPLVHFSTFLDALPLQLGDMVRIAHPLIPPYNGTPALAEVMSKTYTPPTMQVQLQARLLQQIPTVFASVFNEDWEVASSFTPPLDIQNGSAGFGLVKLRTAYTGASIRVRRSSDNTQMDIGFVGVDLDTASLLSFCSGTNGFIVKWYDQSGNGNDVFGPFSASFQPQIVSSGALSYTMNGHPTLAFVGRYLDGNNATDFVSNSEFTVFIVFRVNTISSGATNSGSSSFNNDSFWGDDAGRVGGFIRTSSVKFQSFCNTNAAEQSAAVATNYVGVTQHTGGNCLTYLNSPTAGATQSVTNSSLGGAVMEIGNNVFGALQDAVMPAILFYKVSVSAANLDGIGENLATYYGIAWS